MVAASCSDDNPWHGETGKGGIRLDLAADGNVEDAVPLLRSGSTAPDVPAVGDFAVTLTKKSTAETNEYASLEEFNNANGFVSGGYTVAAHFGSADTEGFGTPYYYGEADVTVLDGKTQEVSVTAKLASSMVSIDYTDAFKTYFKEYGATIHSEGHGYIDFGPAETRPAYIAPGEVSLTVHITNASGKTADLQPASFAALAAHHYHITLDVNNGNVGQAQLVISFDETLDKENVEIDLTDELFTSAKPSIAAVGFTSGDTFETVEGSSIPDALKFNVACPGGFKSATLTIAGEGFNPSFGKEVDLCALSADQLAAMKEYGIQEVRGFDPATGKYALLDISGLPAHLPAGTYTVSLVAMDKFMRVCDPVSVTFTSVPVVFNVAEASALLGSTAANISIDYNGTNPGRDISFKAMDRYGVYRDCEVTDMQMTRSRAVETHTYVFTVNLPDTDRPEVPLKVLLSGKVKVETAVKIVTPEYSLLTDGFSTFGALKIEAAKASELSMITKAVRVFFDGKAIEEGRLSRNAETGIITATGLTPGTTYSVQTSLYTDGGAQGDAVRMTTETATDVENGNFSKTEQPANLNMSVQVGGKYSVWPADYTIKSSIDRTVPTGWATVNALTCSASASNKNSWFVVPSTYVENGKVIIRNVGFDKAGTTPATTGGAFNTKYYCTNVPSFGSGKQAAGELFLGSYNDGGSRSDGIAFNCRPKTMTFEYTYAPNGSDAAVAHIDVLDASGNVIATASTTLAAASSSTTKTLTLPNYNFGVKAASLRIGFKSSNATLPPITVPTGSALDENAGLGNKTIGANSYHAVATGSVLTVANVKLNY